jgi:hypothetical protein
VVTAASQVSPFREHGNHYIQANIVFPVDADQCVFVRTLLDLPSRGKPYICTALGRAMFVPSLSHRVVKGPKDKPSRGLADVGVSRRGIRPTP